MNFGMYDIQEIIYSNLKKANYKGGIPYGKFAKDTAKLIYELFEDKDMHPDMKARARSFGVPENIIKFIDRSCKAFGFSMMQMDEISIDAYKWVIEQEAKGQTIEKFADWARSDEMGRFIGKYRKSGGNIKNDWARAFTENPVNRMNAGEERI